MVASMVGAIVIAYGLPRMLSLRLSENQVLVMTAIAVVGYVVGIVVINEVNNV